jgi:hypothetical protein
MTFIFEDCCKSRKAMTKRAGGGSGVRAIKGSKNQDPSQNNTDPEHCLAGISYSFNEIDKRKSLHLTQHKLLNPGQFTNFVD